MALAAHGREQGPPSCDSDCCLICQARGKDPELMSRLWPNERLSSTSYSVAAVPDLSPAGWQAAAHTDALFSEAGVPLGISCPMQMVGKSHSWPQTLGGRATAGSKRKAEVIVKTRSAPQASLSRDRASSTALASLAVPQQDQQAACSREQDEDMGSQAPSQLHVKRKQPPWELSDTGSRCALQHPPSIPHLWLALLLPLVSHAAS